MWIFLYCFVLSCKKDSAPISEPPPAIDSFLLHPPPVYDSLPFPIKIGNWWKYQRFDSVGYYSNISTWRATTSNCVELITVIAKQPYVFHNYSGVKSRFDTIPSYVFTTKNLTTGVVDTGYLLYYNAAFMCFSKKQSLKFYIKVPIIEGQDSNDRATNFNQTNRTITVLNKTYDRCLNTERYYTAVPSPDGYSNHFITYLKPGIGVVDWKYDETISSHYLSVNKYYYYRMLIDYHLAP